MKKESILAGLGGGFIFGVIQSFSMGPASGVLMGLFFGIGICFFLHKFTNSETIKRQIGLPENVLLPGERVLLTKSANLVVQPKNFGLQNFAFGDLLFSVGMKDKESLGGAMHLTNYRVIFKSHRFNRLRGMASIFLPTIQQLENRSVLVFRKLNVSTVSAQVEFVVNNVDDVISQIVAAMDQIDTRTLIELRNHAAEFPERCCGGLETWNALNRINNFLNLGKKTAGVANAIVNPMAALGSIFRSELIEKPLAEKWEQVFHAAEQHSAPLPVKRRAA